jgi:hypothetical protein
MCNVFARDALILATLTVAVVRGGMISLVPSTTTVDQGQSFQLDVTATDLQLGAYDVTFTYNPVLVSINSSNVIFDTHLGGPDNSFPSVLSGLDNLELAEVSFLTDPADLAALQGPTYPLAHIPVTALQPGTVNFDFAVAVSVGSDYTGEPIVGLMLEGASVTVEGSSPPPNVPEPGTAAITAVGVCLFAASRLRRRMLSSINSRQV